MRMTLVTLLAMALVCNASSAMAHFGMVIPSKPVVTQENKTLDVRVSFSHPFELLGMDMAKPQDFFVVAGETRTDLLPMLEAVKVMDHDAWQASYEIKRPGVYSFAVVPQPYWEPAEGVSIIHYTKAIVPAFGDDQGWDTPIGLPTEIVPLLRPFGNYAGNSFVGQVLLDGKPVADAEVEVEHYSQGGAVKAPSDYHITQVVKADGNGIFTFTCPKAGWWGFAALNEADYQLKTPEGKEMPVELGAVLWVYMDSL